MGKQEMNKNFNRKT